MAFESVEVSSLNSAIKSCENAINYNNTINIIENLSNNSIWKANAKDNLKEALSKLISERYSELERGIKKCKIVAGLIAQYKRIEQEILEKEKLMNQLQKKLYKEKTDENGNKIKEKDYEVVKKIKLLTEDINNSKQELIKIENNVAGIV